MRDLLSPLLESLSADRPVVLSMVVRRRGSLPMARCAKMLSTSDGRTHGTVGGGCLEAEVWAVGRDLLSSGGCSLDTFHLTEVEEGLGGHVCGGTVTILSRLLRPEPRTRELVVELRAAVEDERTVGLVTGLPITEGRAGDLGWGLVDSEAGWMPDGLALTEPIRRRLADRLARPAPATVEDEDRPLFLEPLPPTPTALIFGAGHCGKAIGRAASAAGFRVRMFDDREPFLDPEALPWAESRELVDFERAGASLTLASHHYVVIVTRGHEHDLTLLRQLVDGPSAYVGMIGSRRKRLLFERMLREEGIDQPALERVRSPMGLPIGADTPEEIAVAVVGEMIAARRGVERPTGA